MIDSSVGVDSAVQPKARAPRPMIWILVTGSAAAVLLIGLIATGLILVSLGPTPLMTPRFWRAVIVASALTIGNLALRTLRWIFLLRRCDTRIPIRDAYIGYLSGLSLVFAPLLIGEIAVRAYVLRTRAGVPRDITVVANIWERVLDLAALAAIAGALAVATGHLDFWAGSLIGLGVVLMMKPVRERALGAIKTIVGPLVAPGRRGDASFRDLVSSSTWTVAFVTSVVAWLLPGMALWEIARIWDAPLSIAQAQSAFASSSVAGALALAPAGVVVTGAQLFRSLADAGIQEPASALIVFGVRLATVGVATALGILFVVYHLKARASGEAFHFDQIADAYDAQIPTSRRDALVARKSALMQDVLTTQSIGRRGIDVGCGQGWYVRRMRELGFNVTGIDASAEQVARAERHVGHAGAIDVGSILEIPAPDASYDFAYTINVLHHLPSVDDQRSAFAELFRVLRPGGVLFVHEINTRNVLFRFYMSYVFPSLNCIDEGVERWLLPHKLEQISDAPVSAVAYFTFLPDFAPQGLVRTFAPIERWLERSALRVYSAHFMAVLRKPA